MDDLQARIQAALGDGYALERELGGAGMSRVFVAREVALGRRVVVKVLPPELGAAVRVERFRQEIQLAAGLHHPHIVPLLTAGEVGDLLYYTMPFIEGETLRERLAREGPLPVADVTRITREIADALAYAHRRGVVHRDIKPENVLLSDAHALVTDFGVARALTTATGPGRVTGAGIALGTPVYMAPEQAAADPAADHRLDLYALGVLAYELLGGKPPFAGATPQRILAAQVTEVPQPIDRVRADLPPRLAAAIMRCLAKDPAARWPSAGALRGELDAVPTPTALTAAMRPRRGRRWAAMAGLALVVVAAAVVGTRRHPAPRATSPTLVAVLPFSVRGPEDVAYLGPGLVNLLSTSLDGAGDLRTVDPRAVLSMARQVSAMAPDPASGATTAERLGAGRFVLGDVVAAGSRVRIDATLYDGSRPDLGEASASVEGEAAQLFTLVDQLATQLLAGANGGPASQITRITAVTTASLPALKAYLDGESAFREGRVDSAVAAFQRAVALDTGFALAYYRLSVAAEWATRADVASQAADAAVRRSARLADHDRDLLQALESTRRGDGAAAEQRYRAILGTHPDDIEAWTQLGEVQFHYGPSRGRSSAESRPAWERVLYFDPTNGGALVHLARIAALERRAAEVDSLVARFLKLTPQGDRDLEMRALRAWVTADTAEQRTVAAQLRAASDETVILPVWDVAVYAGEPAAAESLAALLAAPTRDGEAQAVGWINIAYLEMARGRPGAARAAVRRASAADSTLALEFGTLLDLAPFAVAPAEQLARDRWALRHEVPGALPPGRSPSVFITMHGGLHALVRDYLLGLVSVKLGDRATAEGYAYALDAAAAPAVAPGLPHDLGLQVRADLALASGDTARALALLQQRANTAWYELQDGSPVVAESRARLLQGELLAARLGGGRLDPAASDLQQALRLLGSFEAYSAYGLMYDAPARLRRAALEARAGDAAAAARDYDWFLARWRDAEAPLRPMLDSARAGRAALGAAAR